MKNLKFIIRMILVIILIIIIFGLVYYFGFYKNKKNNNNTISSNSVLQEVSENYMELLNGKLVEVDLNNSSLSVSLGDYKLEKVYISYEENLLKFCKVFSNNSQSSGKEYMISYDEHYFTDDDQVNLTSYVEYSPDAEKQTSTISLLRYKDNEETYFSDFLPHSYIKKYLNIINSSDIEYTKTINNEGENKYTINYSISDKTGSETYSFKVDNYNLIYFEDKITSGSQTLKDYVNWKYSNGTFDIDNIYNTYVVNY